MKYTSLIYLLLFIPGLMLVYSLMPKKLRPYTILSASLVFYMMSSGGLVLYLVAAAFVTYGSGQWLAGLDASSAKAAAGGAPMDKAVLRRKKRVAVAVGAGVLVASLLFIKLSGSIAFDLGSTGSHLSGLLGKIAAPLGISFFTLQAVSYISDVYYGKIKADNNPFRVILFLSFFPIIVEGPICRYGQTTSALFSGENLTYHNITYGAQRLLWGVFKKLIVADRLYPLVDTIFNKYSDQSGSMIAVGAIMYTVQLYVDFSGCIDMTIGTAEMFGVSVPENFRQPFFAKTPAEFWRRWHITLGAWLKDYVFYPLSLTKFSKAIGKKARNRFSGHTGMVMQTIIPMFAVWMCNGVWHGAGTRYIFYGLYYFTLVLLGSLLQPSFTKLQNRIGLKSNGVPLRIIQGFKMALIIVTGELFFRANGLMSGFKMIGAIFTRFSAADLINGRLLSYSLSASDFLVIGVGIIVILIVDIVHERGIHIRDRIAVWNPFARWAFLYAVILVVIVFGAYGEGYLPIDPMYAAF